ncbi:hypothetical protein LJ739_06890 [Aestuariibacter halophilus]|uniref:Uncharacterized protein n=1 Tax=Fluctibacter halophilus TaxID=226011 RepID=A0ABS8G6D2_9ALTE|nr:hypothetical protein [Aestuariibacter halophilus]MCC2615963.1 hypothetical protein [Aestuariibacter halophilus]
MDIQYYFGLLVLLLVFLALVKVAFSFERDFFKKAGAQVDGENVVKFESAETKRLKQSVQYFLESEQALANQNYDEYLVLKQKAKELAVKVQKAS